MKKRLLITGTSGFLGRHLCKLAATDFQILAAGRDPARQPRGTEPVLVDFLQPEQAANILERCAFDAAVHAAAMAEPNICEKQPRDSQLVNVEATARIAELCARRGVPMLSISTDLVFDGTRAPYREDDPMAPINTYGQHKAKAEESVLRAHSGNAVLRLPMLYGRPDYSERNFLASLLQQLAAGQRLRLFSDEIRTPVHAEDAARGILLALKQGYAGRLHLGGTERVSRAEFGRTLTEVMGLGEDRIENMRQADWKMAAARPADVSLDSSRAGGLGYAPRNVRQGITDALAK